MNLAALKCLIDYLESNGIASCEEKRISVVLTLLDEEAPQQCEIIESLELAKHYCISTLKTLKNKGVIVRTGKRDIFYHFANRLILSQTITGGLTAPNEAPSPAHVNMLTLVNSTELNAITALAVKLVLHLFLLIIILWNDNILSTFDTST